MESRHLFEKRFELDFKTDTEKHYYFSPVGFGEEPGIQIKYCGTLAEDPKYFGCRHKNRTAFQYIFVLEYITKGKGLIETANGDYNVCAGDTVLIRRRTECVYYPDKDDPYEKIWFNICGQIMVGYTELFGLTDPVTVIHVDTRALFEKMLDIVLKMDTGNHSRVYAEFSKVLPDIFEAMASSREEASVKSNKLAYRVKQMIDTSPNYRIKISDIADELFYSQRHLNRVFFSEFGMLPEKYICKQKIEDARIMLLNEKDSTKQIAELLGFCDVHYFMRVFAKTCGETVGAYRKRMKELRLKEF